MAHELLKGKTAFSNDVDWDQVKYLDQKEIEAGQKYLDHSECTEHRDIVQEIVNKSK